MQRPEQPVQPVTLGLSRQSTTSRRPAVSPKCPMPARRPKALRAGLEASTAAGAPAGARLSENAPTRGTSHVIFTASVYAGLALHPLVTRLGVLTAPAPAPLVPTIDVAPLTSVIGFAAVLLATLAPDIDCSGATLVCSLGQAGCTVARLLEHLLDHRGPLHRLLAAVCAAAVTELAGRSWLGLAGLGYPVVAGWIAHLLLDAMTPAGVPLLWPLLRRPVHAAPARLIIPTGSAGEAFVAWGTGATCLVWVLARP